jgi:hypothetical protein
MKKSTLGASSSASLLSTKVVSAQQYEIITFLSGLRKVGRRWCTHQVVHASSGARIVARVENGTLDIG